MRRRSETVVAMLLFACAGCAIAFVVFYAIDRLGRNTQVMGLALGGALIFLAVALMVTAARLVVSEELEHDYPEPEHPEEQQAIEQVVAESGDRLTAARWARRSWCRPPRSVRW